MVMSPADVVELTKDVLLPALETECKRLDLIDRWWRWDHDKPYQPKQSTREYKDLSTRAQTPWLGLVVTSVAQELYVEDYRRADNPDDLGPWQVWQRNGMDSRQIAVHRSALAYGLSYVTVLPGTDPLTDEPMPVIRGMSPRRMIALYADPVEDEWPEFALRRDPTPGKGKAGRLRVYDDSAIYLLRVDDNGAPLEPVTVQKHDIGVCPVVRYANSMDLEGRTAGEVEPFIPVSARIDQTTFDRLIVQRFSSWKVRTIAGMAMNETIATRDNAAATDDERRAAAAATKMELRVEDLLIAEDADTKFGTLDATPLDGFIKAKDADIRDLAAVTQTPPHHLLGQIANLSAEALAAAEAGLTRKVVERQHGFGESHEQTLRLSGHVMGDEQAAADFEAQVRWRDMESRSLAQAADALGKIATMLKVPVQLLWEKIPGWTQQDVVRATQLVEEGDALGQILAKLEGHLDNAETPVGVEP